MLLLQTSFMLVLYCQRNFYKYFYREEFYMLLRPPYSLDTFKLDHHIISLKCAFVYVFLKIF